MTTKQNTLLAGLGFLRLGLIALALLNILIPTFDLLAPVSAPVDDRDLWTVLTTLIAPVMAPLLIVVLFFDYIMSRVRAADAEGAQRRIFTAIGRVDLAAIGVSLLFWVPYFSWRL